MVSFYTQDNSTLQKHTTKESYESFITVQSLLSPEEKKESKFKVLNEKMNREIAGIQFTSAYSDEPEIFKHIKEVRRLRRKRKGKKYHSAGP